MGSSEEEEEEEGGEEEEEEEEEDEIPLQEVEELLADNGAMDYLSSLREQCAPPVSTSGGDGGQVPGEGRGQGSAFPPLLGPRTASRPLFPPPGAPLGLSPGVGSPDAHGRPGRGMGSLGLADGAPCPAVGSERRRACP